MFDKLPEFDPKIVTDLISIQFTSAIHSLPDSERVRLKGWLTSVQEIKKSTTSESEKRKQLEALHAPALVYDILKSYVASFAESKSISNKETVKNILDSAQVFIKPRTFMVASLIGMGINKVLPQVLMRPESEIFLSKLGSILADEIKSDQSS